MTEYKKSAMQRLSETSDNMELWWDSSPLIFDTWKKEMLEKAEPSKKEMLEKQLTILFDPVYLISLHKVRYLL